jgi:hypothetical protein
MAKDKFLFNSTQRAGTPARRSGVIGTHCEGAIGEIAPALDHLVIAASTLAEGVAWCEQTLGVSPGPGGAHPLFGTHNRLLRLQTETAQACYLEIIAIDPAATPQRAAPLARWFDLDQSALQAQLRERGPQLVHWVLRVPDINATLNAWQALGIDRGPALTASRPMPQGLLQWRISVRGDGQRLMGGALPTLIEWGQAHPCDAMPDSGLTLSALTLHAPDSTALQSALAQAKLHNPAVQLRSAPAGLSARLRTPRGDLTLTHTSP